MLDNSLRGALRFARRDTDVPAVAFESPQQTADARIDPVLKQPDSLIALAIGVHRLIRHFFAHAHIFHERPAQLRADKFAQRRRIRHGKAELLRRIAYAVPNAFLRAGQRTVQIKNYTFAHRKSSPSTPKQRDSRRIQPDRRRRDFPLRSVQRHEDFLRHRRLTRGQHGFRHVRHRVQRRKLLFFCRRDVCQQFRQSADFSDVVHHR